MLDDCMSHWKPIVCFTELIETYLPFGGSVMEVGCFTGDTTLSYAPIVKSRHGHVFLVDWFMGNEESPSETYHGYKRLPSNTVKSILEYRLRQTGCMDITTIIDAKSDIAIEDDKLKNKKFDIIFIDADHTYEGVMKDLNNYFGLVKEGGIFCGHDYAHEGVKLAVDKFFSSKNKAVTILEDPKGQIQPVWVVKFDFPGMRCRLI